MAKDLFKHLAAAGATAVLTFVASPQEAQAQTDPRAAARAEMDVVRQKMEAFKRQHGRMPNPQEFAEMRGKPTAPACPGVEAGQPQRKPEEILADARRAAQAGDLEAARRLSNPALLACTEAAATSKPSSDIAVTMMIDSFKSIPEGDAASCKAASDAVGQMAKTFKDPQGEAKVRAALAQKCGPKQAP
jgi:hypothetical protein